MYSIYVYTDPSGTEHPCYQCAQEDCTTKPFLTLDPPLSRFVCEACDHATAARLVEIDGVDARWEPDDG